jgi:NlpC/P60 family
MRRARQARVLSMCGCALLLFPLAAYGRSSADTVTGTWSSDWGIVTLTQSGSSVSGTYTHDQGKIQGTIAGGVVKGTWSEAPSYKAPNDAGAFEWTLASKSFTGKWRYGEVGTTWSGTWTARCTGGPCLQNGAARASDFSNDARAAIAWARRQLGSAAWAGRCEAFIERAYSAPQGTRYQSAFAAAKALHLHKTPITEAPPGAILFFGPSVNCPRAISAYGHAGLSIGGGKMINAQGAIVETDAATSEMWRRAYLGWAYPRASWPGR